MSICSLVKHQAWLKTSKDRASDTDGLCCDRLVHAIKRLSGVHQSSVGPTSHREWVCSAIKPPGNGQEAAE